MTTNQRPMLGEPPAGFDEDQLKYPDPPEIEPNWKIAERHANTCVSADMIEEALNERVNPWEFRSLSPIVHSWLEDDLGYNKQFPLPQRIEELSKILFRIRYEEGQS